ncbi:MAG TPA: T9SS type A sorting domain-containing protein [Chitinophagales bacterium]|nr:T9SS type A sorting domain-containing protein [Chitinophagales bacterium]
MKTLYTLLIFSYLTVSLQAQYCGHTGNPSGPGQCTPTGLPYKGFEKSDSLEPLTNGFASTSVIQFRNYDTVYFQNQGIIIDWVQIDSIGNLPNGLCWSTNKANNRFGPGELGCIKINGTACDDPGQYCLKIIIGASIGVPTIDGPTPQGFFLRLRNLWDAETPIDTSQTFANPVIFYGNAAACTDIMDGVKRINELEKSLAIAPNPFTNHTTVQFYSSITGNMTQTITTLLGNEVYRKETEVIQGENRLTIDAGNLSAGIYFYSISNGISKAVKRIVIE